MGKPVNHGQRIAAALALVSSGAVATKKEAAALVGVAEGSLAPGRINLPDRVQGLNQTQSPALLDIMVEVLRDGRRVQVPARECFARGVLVAVQLVDDLGPKLATLTGKQRAQLADARQWLKMCREFDLFPADPKPSGPDPGEMQAIHRAKERKGSAAHFIAQRRDSGAAREHKHEHEAAGQQAE